MLYVNFEIQIPDHEFEFSYARSSGPGGQNVNKVNSKVLLRWNALNSPAISAPVRSRFLTKFASRLNESGEIVITSDRFRDQGRNREDCLHKLKSLLLEVATPPKPRKKTKPSRSSVERHKNKKRKHSEKKRTRGRVEY